ncbi:hypothetical protein QQ045_030571 [Rhodiola kirilowii]
MEQNITESSALSCGANHYVEEAHGHTKSESNVSSDKINFEDEVRRLENDVRIVVEGVSESVVYRNIIFQLKNDPGINSNIARVLGSEKHMLMVVYALGNIEAWYWSQQQLALAILLKRDFNWIGEIEVFDPLISHVDRKVLEDMGCLVLSVNENCRRQVTKPTIFFMPFAEFRLKKNLFEANILPSQLNHMVILSDHEIYEPDTEPRSFDQAVYMAYRIAVKKFTSFFQLNPFSNSSKTDFGSFHWSFLTSVIILTSKKKCLLQCMKN